MVAANRPRELLQALTSWTRNYAVRINILCTWEIFVFVRLGVRGRSS